MDLRIDPEFQRTTVPLGDFAYHRLYLIDHRGLSACALVEHEANIDGRTKDHKIKMEAVRTCSAALHRAMMASGEGDEIDVCVLGWGNRNATSIHVQRSSASDKWRPETTSTSTGIKAIVGMDNEDVLVRSETIVKLLERDEVEFSALVD